MRNTSEAIKRVSIVAMLGALGAGVFYACASNDSTTSPANTGGSGGTSGGAGGGTSDTGAGGTGQGGTGTGGAGTGGTGTGGAGTGGAGGAGTGGTGTGGTDSGSADSSSGDATINPSCGGTDASVLFSPPSNPTGSWPPPALKLTPVGGTFSHPTLAIGAPGDTSRLYVVEQGGLIRIVKLGGVDAGAATTFLDVTTLAAYNGLERGLLGLAFHPGYAQNGRFFVYYNEKSHGDIRIVEYARSSGDPDKANATAVKTLVSIVHQNGGEQGNHNGGMIAFGKDGLLYAGTGDGGGGGDQDGNAQNMNVELGKILRFDVDHPDCSPAGNLKNRIWDYGVRNPWRWSFDRLTGDLYIGDVGQDAYEEVDVEPQGQGNKNYGWNQVEGTHCYKAGCDMTNKVKPILDYAHGVSNCIIGGFVYRGAAIPSLTGTYFYGDHGGNKIWALQWLSGSLAHGPLDVTADLSPGGTSINGQGAFGQDTAGELYVVNNGGGSIYRIDAE